MLGNEPMWAFHMSKKRIVERDDVQSNKKTRANITVAKQSVEIATLRRELSIMKEKGKEDDITAEVANLLNTPKNNKAPNKEIMSVARQVMTIVARKMKDE